MRIEVYSDADEVELIVNGHSSGRRPTGRDEEHLAKFEVTYEPGELIAVAYTNGIEVARSILPTVSSDVRLTATPDRALLRADDTD